MTMNRAYSLLEIKSVDDDHRTIEGIASTPTADRMGDIVEPKGAVFKLPLPLLYQHNSRQPIGHVVSAKVTDGGIVVKAQIAKGVAPFIDEAWALIKAGLVRGLSIGFKIIESARIKDSFSEHIQKWEWLELSAVTIPANSEANIQTVKSLDSQLRAASGTGVVRLGPTPGATGKQTEPGNRFFFDPSKGKDMKTTAEHIASLEAKRAAHTARMKAIEDEAAEAGTTMDEAQGEEHDRLSAEIKTIDIDLKRRRESEALMIEKATPIKPAQQQEKAQETGTQQRQGVVTGMGNSAVPKSIQFTRVAMCLMRAKGDTFQALQNAKMYKDTPDVEQAVQVLMHAKAAVAAGNTTDSTWAAPLVVYQNLASAFIELLRPMTILGKLPGMASVPFNVSIPRQTAGSTSGWVGEDDPKPVSRLSLETITLGHTKIATIVVLTEELVQDSDPSAEALVQRDMLASIRAYSDTQFIDPTVTASGTVRPASITNGLTDHPMTGTAVANVLTDVQTLMSGFINANLDFTGAVWVMHPRTALYLSMLLSPLGTMQFPSITVSGGTFMGFPVITSASVPIDTGNDTYIVLLSAPDILMADKGLVVDVSREASLQMDSAPTDSAQSMISLWQNNLVGIRAERRINYRRRREAAVQVLSDVSY